MKPETLSSKYIQGEYEEKRYWKRLRNEQILREIAERKEKELLIQFALTIL